MRFLIDNSGYTLKNYGDSAMLVAAAERLKDIFPDAEIRILTDAPEELIKIIPFATPVSINGRRIWENPRNLFGGLHKLLPKALHPKLEHIETLIKIRFPMWSFSRMKTVLSKFDSSIEPLDQYINELLSADAIIATGGGYITDVFDFHSKRVLKMLSLAQSLGKPTALFGQGLGPANSQDLLFWSRRVFNKLNILTLREGVYSEKFALSCGARSNTCSVTGDDAIGMANSLKPAQIGDFIGVNIRAASYSGINSDELDTIKKVLSECAKQLEAPLCGIPISSHNEDSDLKSIGLLLDQNALQKSKLLDTPRKVIEQVGACRVVITGSYHAGVFALSQGASVIGVASNDYYRYKFKGLSGQFPDGCKVVDRDGEDFAGNLKKAIIESWETAPETRPKTLLAASNQLELGLKAYKQFAHSLSKTQQ